MSSCDFSGDFEFFAERCPLLPLLTDAVCAGVCAAFYSAHQSLADSAFERPLQFAHDVKEISSIVVDEEFVRRRLLGI